MNVNLTGWRNRKALKEDQPEFTLSIDHKGELYKTVMRAVLSEGAGRSDPQRRAMEHSLRQLIGKNEPAFVAKLAIYVQEQLHAHDLAFFLSATLAVGNPDKGDRSDKDATIGSLVERIIRQPAAITEWLDAYAEAYLHHHGKRLRRPGRALIKILSPVFNRLDEFQYTRCNRDQQARIRKALWQIRPVAKDRTQRELFGKITKDLLPARTAWYEELDAVRKQHYDSMALKRAALKDKWGEMILSWKISYNDLLDHLPVILQAGLGGRAIQLLPQYLGNAGAVAKNGHLPTRYLQAYRKVQALEHYHGPAILEALEKAAILSAANIPGFTAETRVVIAMDVSNSMKRAVSEDSRVDRFDIAPLLGMVLSYRCSRLTTGLFGNTWKPIGLPENHILKELDTFQNREGEVGFAANGYQVLRELIRKNQVADKIMIFTDCKLWNNRQPNQSPGTDIARLWRQYKQVAPHARLYLFDLAAYGDSPLELLPDDVFLVAGWNDRIFAVLDALDGATTSF